MFERFTRDARAAVVLAREEARDLAAGEIGPQHLLLGVLQADDPDLSTVLSGFGLTADVVRAKLAAAGATDDGSFDDDADALRSIGIDLHAVRDAVAHTFGADAFEQALGKSGRRRRRRGHVPFSRPAKKSLELALREVLVHKDNEIRCEHLVLGILRAGDPATVDVIAGQVDPARLRASVVALLDRAA
ncbi:MAG TPA: Clp protease N-terminal domain-containing protein [Mycobacterium sp.]|nr:Clp protease N-terminal domain-containing protein [Mycobacterium sp.]